MNYETVNQINSSHNIHISRAIAGLSFELSNNAAPEQKKANISGYETVPIIFPEVISIFKL